MKTKHLTHKQKLEYFPLILKRDGSTCFYCKEVFITENTPVFDHLLDNPEDNSLENLCLCHQSCNIAKKFNFDWKILAQAKFEENIHSTFACEGNQEGEELTEQIISQTNRELTKSFLLEHTMNDEAIFLSDVVNGITNICNDNNNTGSSTAIRRYIDVLTNPFNGSFIKEKNPDGRIIIRRKKEREILNKKELSLG